MSIFINSLANFRYKGKETILIVEDETEVLRLTSRILTSKGFKIIEANSPGEAIQICRKRGDSVDLVLTDVIMPNMSGPELVTEIMKQFPEIKVLYMSGFTADIIAVNSIISSDVPFIHKPFSLKSLIDKVSEILDQ